jgi:AdoMet-dependent heme synthase
MYNDINWVHPPKIIQWDTTSNCNLNCKHCRASNLDRVAEDLTFDESILMLDEINKLAPNASLAMAGGEPLMRKDIHQILSYIRKNLSLSVELLTNATLIDENNIPWLAELVDGFNISMEGATAEVHDAIRGKGAFDRTIKAVDLLVKEKVPLAVRMTYFGQGEEEVEHLIRLVYSHGVDSFNFRYVVPVGNASGTKVDPIQHERLSIFIWDLCKSLNMTIGFSDPFPELLTSKIRKDEIEGNQKLSSGEAVTGCSVAFSLLYINPQGMVQFCPYFPVEIESIKNKAISDIWFKNEKFNLFRHSRSFLTGRCGECKYKFACGGCRGAAYAMGDYLGEDPRCWRECTSNIMV